MTLSDLRAEWESCRMDDPARAHDYELDIENLPSTSRAWYISLLDRAQREGWNDHPEFRDRLNWSR